jgi:hypothetical protein
MSLTQAHVEIDQDHPGSQHKIIGINLWLFKIGRINKKKDHDMHPVFIPTEA